VTVQSLTLRDELVGKEFILGDQFTAAEAQASEYLVSALREIVLSFLGAIPLEGEKSRRASHRDGRCHASEV
jgi:hypothetical protein